MNYILSHKTLAPSARELVSKLFEMTGNKFPIKYDPLLEPPIIRWGNSNGSYPENDTNLNKSRLIRICANKLAFSNFMGLTSIPYVEIEEHEPREFPIVVRKTLTGMGGRGVVVCRNLDEYRESGGRYWSKFYRFQYELGVHIFSGMALKVFKKVWGGSEPEPDYPIRNLDKGYSFKRVNPGSFSKLHPFVQNFYDQFGLEFGRLDVGWDSQNSCYRIIEANSGPSLSSNEDTLDMYAKFLAERVL